MTKAKATFATTAIMALLAAVIFFVWKFGNGLGFAVIEGIFAVSGDIRRRDAEEAPQTAPRQAHTVTVPVNRKHRTAR